MRSAIAAAVISMAICCAAPVSGSAAPEAPSRRLRRLRAITLPPSAYPARLLECLDMPVADGEEGNRALQAAKGSVTATERAAALRHTLKSALQVRV